MMKMSIIFIHDSLLNTSTQEKVLQEFQKHGDVMFYSITCIAMFRFKLSAILSSVKCYINLLYAIATIWLW